MLRGKVRLKMTKLRSSMVVCATICAVLVLALAMSPMVSASSLRLISHGPVAPPDGDGGDGGNIISHGPVAPPDGDGGDGGNIIAHGPVAPPDGDGGDGGNIIAHGPVAPPDGDGGDGGNVRLA
jgi:hypothetical protein